MKKFLLLMAVMFVVSGCSSSDTGSSSGGGGAVEATTEDTRTPEEKFTDGDFVAYAENGAPVLSLAMNKETAEKRLESFKDEIGEFQVDYAEHLVTSKTENAVSEQLVQYIGYDGPWIPIYTSKGIKTTGPLGKDDACSSVDDVIKAYDIDTDKENYRSGQEESNSYTISLYYDNEDKRIIVDKDEEIDVEQAQKFIRFTITNDAVKNIEFYQYRWE